MMVGKQRPQIELRASITDKVLVLAGWAAIAAIWIFILANYRQLPKTIPVHFNGAGEVDRYGVKSTIFSLPAIATILFLGLTILNKYPHSFNYPVEITEENALSQYTNAVRLINIIRMIITIIFGSLILNEVKIANGKKEALGLWFLPAVLVLVFTPLIFFIIRSFKRR